MKNFFYTVAALVLFIALYSYFFIAPRFGQIPEGVYLASISTSPHYDQANERFVNENQKPVDEFRKSFDRAKSIRRFLTAEIEAKPKEKLPSLKPDLSAFMADDGQLKFIWFGHSTFMVRIGGKTLLFDPVFSGAASPLDLVNERFQDPALQIDELPPIDYVIISHDHYDHLDVDSVTYFKDKGVTYFTSLGLTSHLKSWGINESQITELDWWQEAKIGDLTFVCTPAQHFSGRSFSNQNKTLWCSWVIAHPSHRFFFSGDGGYAEHFKKIGDKFGPFDVSFLENGQYNQDWKLMHMMPEESAQAYFDLKSKAFMPIHWGMFNMSVHNWYDPIVEIEKLAREKGVNLLAPKLGELVIVGESKIFDKWWESYISSP